MNKIAPYAKAITGAIIAGLASLQQALGDGVVDAGESTGIAIATLTALALVWAIPNGEKTVVEVEGDAYVESEPDGHGQLF